MKPILRRACAALAAFSGLAGLHGAAAAATWGQDMSSCTREGRNSAGGLFQSDGATGLSGLQDDTGNGVSFVCPILRVQETGPNGLRVTLDGNFHGLDCWLISDDYTSLPLGRVENANLDTSTGATSLQLPPSAIAPWSQQSLGCKFPVAVRYSNLVSAMRIDM